MKMCEVIKDFAGKTICHLDAEKRQVEIRRKGTKTVIQLPEGKPAKVIRIK